MDTFSGKTAVITGAGSGLGLALAEACADLGMSVAACDIRGDRLTRCVDSITASGGVIRPFAFDVSDRNEVERAAADIEAAFGSIHLVFNNAGIAMHGVPIAELPVPDWNWVIDVNVYGVIHGMQVFLPLIRKHGQGGHIVNTASIGGFQIRPGWNTGAYSMTKYAVVALSETLHQDLDGTNIRVSVVCPAMISTDLSTSDQNRPKRFGGSYRRPENDFVADLSKAGMTPRLAAARVIEGVKNDEFFIFTHSHPQVWLEERHEEIRKAFNRVRAWERSVGILPAEALSPSEIDA